MKKLSSIMLLAMAALAFQSCGGANNDSKENADSANYAKDTANAVATGGIAVVNDDAEFAVAAANGGMAEVEFSKLAQARANNAKVKDFADMMVKDHTMANEELKGLARAKNITLPTTIGADKQETMDELQKKGGAEFDKKYVDVMVADHKEAVDLFEKASTDCKDADLKAFATKTLPTLKSHLQAIETIQKGM